MLTVPYFYILSQQAKDLWLPYNQVQGMAVEFNEQPYTLNFEQQKKIIAILNQAIPIDDHSAKEPFDYDKLIVYRFDEPFLEIFPIRKHDKKLIFLVSNYGTMIENGGENLNELLLQSVGP